jgi:hypothetical protein
MCYAKARSPMGKDKVQACSRLVPHVFQERGTRKSLKDKAKTPFVPMFHSFPKHTNLTLSESFVAIRKFVNHIVPIPPYIFLQNRGTWNFLYYYLFKI